MISSWLEEINYKGITSGIANIEENENSGIMSLYTLDGQKLSACSAPSVFRQAKQGCYVALFKRGGKYVAAKIIK